MEKMEERRELDWAMVECAVGAGALFTIWGSATYCFGVLRRGRKDPSLWRYDSGG